MRFFADGPSLPDELLAARDEGRVLFVCGAGVSRDKAKLPDFIGLARKVLRELRVLPESPAYKLVETVEKQTQIAGVGGLLAADRIFGLLEREFPVRAIEAAVGMVLKPAADVDLTAHRIMLDLSTDANRKTRLVTTNFELLFEKTKPRLPIYTPLNLPPLRHVEDFEGIVHLHGMFDAGYDKSVGGNLVLSSGEFGRAYLAEGWATDFIRAAFDKYIIVFVGYAADDPPVQYLLEALYRVGGPAPGRRYAFQDGRADEATALWRQKGVTAIPYTADGADHSRLWNTLAAWAERARNPQRWHKKVLRSARRGPDRLAPHERGQVFHLAMTEDGARAIAESNPPLPASWLCVFDHKVRYTAPGKVNPIRVDDPTVDPFTHFAIDDDPEPAPTDPSQPFQQRAIPANVADALTPKSWDYRDGAGQLRGHRDQHATQLSPRMASLGTWLWRVSNQPAAAWWAADQVGLHPSIVSNLEFALDHRDLGYVPLLRSTWRYILEAWRRSASIDHDAFALNATFNRDGWTRPLIRELIEIRRCGLNISRPYWGGVLPPTGTTKRVLRELINIEIAYPDHHIPIAIPDDQLETVVPLLRGNLEYAVDLNNELSPHSAHIAPIVPDPNLPGDSAEREYGINVCVFEYVDVFERLWQKNPAAAKAEWRAWRGGKDPVFARLRIWAAGLAGFLTPDEAAAEFAALDDTLFWGSRDQRDLLLALKARWQDISTDARLLVEQRIIGGPPKAKRATAAQNKLWHAIEVLDRLAWLAEEGCSFQTPTAGIVAKLRKAAPQWTDAQGKRAADSNEARGGTVVSDKSITSLTDVPLSELIPHALTGQPRGWGTLTERDPLGGLAEKRPLRLLAALAYEEREGHDSKEAWTRFLYNSARRNDAPRLSLLIARRLAALVPESLKRIVQPAAYWLEAVKDKLHPCQSTAVYALFDALCTLIELDPAAADNERRDKSGRRDWLNVAFGSAAGHLSEILFADMAVQDMPSDAAIVQIWLARALRLLRLPDDHARYSLVRFARRLGWLHWHARDWSEQHVLQPLLGAGIDHDAALAGFYSNARIYDARLYALLKPQLIAWATERRDAQRRDTMALGGLFVGGWRQQAEGGMRWLTDEEFQRVLIYTDDDLRGHVLWHVGHFEIADKLTFLRHVWPLQLAVRTPLVVGRLCSLAFGDAVHFVELVDAILPLVADGNGDSLILSVIQDSKDTITAAHPEKVLALLSAVLSYNVYRWPYGMDKTFAKIVETDPRLAQDPRYVRLKTLWDER
jgi:hypothetical protein